MDRTELIEVNSYIIIQRHGYFKLHQLVNNSSALLGKDKVNLSNVVGKPYWTLFKMTPHKGKKREFDLEECSQAETISQEIVKAVSCGSDNRNICDDGSSQTLSSEDINGMRESGLSGHVILEKIVENSKTFKDKTEYSQEKYLKKKAKKYFEYIIIRKPSLRLLADIFYSRDQLKIMGLRHDTLSQIITATNIQHDGVYALFENGSQALVAASILSFLSEKGLLINLALGSNPQKQAILAMNFKHDTLSQLINVRIKDILGDLKAKSNISNQLTCSGNNDDSEIKFDKGISKEENSSTLLLATEESMSTLDTGITNEESINNNNEQVSNEGNKILDGFNDDSQFGADGTSNKRKHSLEESEPVKKPRWAVDFERASEAFESRKLNGIVIVCKEYPHNIITHLIPFLKPSCQLVVYCSFREPLVQLYIELKKRRDVVGIHLTENWLRMYQVLPERTHPTVNMSFSGHLLIATKVL